MIPVNIRDFIKKPLFQQRAIIGMISNTGENSHYLQE